MMRFPSAGLMILLIMVLGGGIASAAGLEKWITQSAERSITNPVSYWEYMAYFTATFSGKPLTAIAAVSLIWMMPDPHNAVITPRLRSLTMALFHMATRVAPLIAFLSAAWLVGGALYYAGAPGGVGWGPNLGIFMYSDASVTNFAEVMVTPVVACVLALGSAASLALTLTTISCCVALLSSRTWARAALVVIVSLVVAGIAFPPTFEWISPAMWSGPPGMVMDLPSALSVSLVVLLVGVGVLIAALVIDAVRAGRLLPEGARVLMVAGGAYMLATLIFPHLDFAQRVMPALEGAMGGARVGLESRMELSLFAPSFLAIQCLVAIPMVVAYFNAESIRDLGPGMWVRGGAQWRLVAQYFPSILRVSGLVLGVLGGVVVLGLLGVPAAITNLTWPELADVAWVLALTFGQMVFGATLVMVVRAHTSGPLPAVAIGIILFALPMFVQTRFVPSGQGHPLYVAQSSTVENLMSAGVLLVSIAMALALAVLFPRLRFRSLEDAS